MNAILKIIEKRNLYTHLILFKIYIETEGKTNKIFSGNMTRELKELLKENFSSNDFRTATQYLGSEGLTANNNGNRLTIEGRRYIEDWARGFESLNEEEKIILVKKLPDSVSKFFNILDKAHKIGSFIELILKIS